MKKFVLVLILSSLTLTSCSSGSPRIGGKCDFGVDTIAENSHGATIICYSTGKWMPNEALPTPMDLLED